MPLSGGPGTSRPSDGRLSGPRTEAEAKRIWRRLGGQDGGGKVKIAAIVKNARYLENTFPELLRRFAEVAEHGEVAWEAFRLLFSGRARRMAVGGRVTGQRPLVELQAVFDRLDADGSGALSLEDVIKHRDFIDKEMPELLSKWSDIDVDGSNTVSWDEFRAYFGGTDEWLEFQLGEIVGLEELKDQIRRFHRSMLLDGLRRKRGFAVDSGCGTYHMIFQGNPGTGKTSMGRIMAKLLHRIGLTTTDSLREVQREQLVAGYIGQTAGKTQKEIGDAVGGILFIDEAYRLAQGGEKDFGKEAIEQLMGAMTEPPAKAPTLIFAGYPAEMATFMSQNDGLYRRIAYTFDFPDYSCSDLAEILELLVAKRGYTIEDALSDRARPRLATLIERNTLARTRMLMNGGLCERVFALAKQALDARDDPSNPSVELNRADITAACQQIPPPPEPQSGGDAGAGEARELRLRVGQLQAELERLRSENAELRRELAAMRSAEAECTGSGDVTWQVKFSSWVDCPPEQQELFSKARRAGQALVSFLAHGNSYEADLTAMIQRNTQTGTERKLREQPL